MRLASVRKVAKQEVEDWIKSNPRKAGETVRQYQARGAKEIRARVSSAYAGSPFLTFLLQIIPLLLEFWFRRNT